MPGYCNRKVDEVVLLCWSVLERHFRLRGTGTPTGPPTGRLAPQMWRREGAARRL